MGLFRPVQTLEQYKNFNDMPQHDLDQRQHIRIVEAPNRVNHRYYIPPVGKTITNTPHREIFGSDVTSLMYHENYQPMDDATKDLYFALKSLRATFGGSKDFDSSISILPYSVEFEGPVNPRSKYYRGNWKRPMDRQVANVISEHLNWDPAKTWVESRRQSSDELHASMAITAIRGSIASGKNLTKGFLPGPVD